MLEKKSLRKYWPPLLVAGLMSLAWIQNVAATPGEDVPPVKYYEMKQWEPMNAEVLKKYETFLQDTKELRKNMMVKRAEMHALMRGDNPDSMRVSALAGELFDLHEQLRVQAVEKGLPRRVFTDAMGKRCKMMQSDGPMKGVPSHCPSRRPSLE